MPAVMVTFVEATFVLATFVHMTNTSPVTDPYCTYWSLKNYVRVLLLVVVVVLLLLLVIWKSKVNS